MRPIKDTIPLDEARQLIDAAITPVRRMEVVSLAAANGRVLARDVVSERDVPPFARAAMDGYAVVAADTFGASRYEPRTLRVVEKIFTGHLPVRRVEPGEAAEIATGAPMPEGADAVVMVEETERPGEQEMRVFTPVYPRQNVGRQGADIQRGQTVLRAGELLNPSRVGAVAALGLDTTSRCTRARRWPSSRPATRSSNPGTTLAPGQIYDINRFTLSAIIAEHGGTPVAYRTAEDTIDDLERAIDRCLDQDVMVFSGGSSVGERDLVLDVIARRGEIVFHGIAVKPGKPTAFGIISGKPVFGMPGYPTSCLSNGYMLLIPALRHMAHLPPHQMRTRSRRPSRSASSRRRGGISSTRSAWSTASRIRRSRRPETSRRCRRPTATSRSPRRPTSSKKGEMVEVKLF